MIIIEDNIITVQTPANNKFVIRIGVDGIDVTGLKPSRTVDIDSQDILTFKTLEPNSLRLSIQ